MIGVADLFQRLEALPLELGDLYGRILASIEPSFYKGQAVKHLEMFSQWNSTLSAHPIPMTGLALSFTDDLDPNLALSADLQVLWTAQMSGAELVEIQNRRQLWCEYFLSVHLPSFPGNTSVNSIWEL